MSRKDRKTSYIEKDVLEEIDTLRKENNNLKKRIGKLRKQANKSTDLDDLENTFSEEEETILKKEIKCPMCGGTLKKVIVLDIALNVCQKCKNRVKIT